MFVFQVKVDMMGGLKKATLDGLTSDLWPRSTAVDSLAAEAAKLKEKGVHYYKYLNLHMLKFMHCL